MTKQVLIIDDEESIREIVRACLEDLGGWTTLSATSGTEGLEQVQKNLPDAILLDISMPDMDGFQFFQQLQANPNAKRIPVIVLTAKVLPSDRLKFAKMGATGFIAKPFNPVLLHHQVADILRW